MYLLDRSERRELRRQALAPWAVQVVSDLTELVGVEPDGVVVDAVGYSPQTMAELQAWGWEVYAVAEKVTWTLRRQLKEIPEVLGDAELVEYLAKTYPVASVAQASVAQANPDVAVAALETGPTQVESVHRKARLFVLAPLRTTGTGGGKTGLTFNLAAYAVQAGLRVLCIDLDPSGTLGNLANTHGHLSMTTEHWMHLYKQRSSERLTERTVSEHVERDERYGFAFVAAPGRQDVVPPQGLAWMIDQVSPYFDWILMDTHASFTETLREALLCADELILCGVHDPVQYPMYKDTIDLMTHPLLVGKSPEHLHIVLNRAYLGKQKQLELSEMERQLTVPVEIAIPEDPAYFMARSKHQAIAIEQPKAESAKAMKPLLDALVATSLSLQLPALVSPNPRRSVWGRILRKKAVSTH
ncbi:ParA family protein [Alicyclobacillus sp. SP_1]|uniref:MinD/ParA family ATP-binding protein n=1 Tax=Alicyclobacillus sp. SP_1 TaxID=2942475 RepID=UPI0021588266|nr:ParA family protein [Alicyclobacillus sp. SP_1]